MDKVNSIIRNKRAADPNGFNKALKEGPIALKSFIMKELKSMGVDSSKIPWKEVHKWAKENEDSFSKVSELLDENIFDPWLQLNATSFEKNILGAIPNPSRFKKLDTSLRSIKLVCAGLGVLCMGAFMSAIFGRRIASMLFYGVATVDLCKISYNCYIKRYICSAMTKLGGNMTKATETFFTWMTSAAGISNDPFAIIKDEISFELITKDTTTIKIYSQIKDFWKDAKKIS